ncbi:CLUMA_CG017860, isoform A [Clunio marinus]|uniref:CLUMA_CG017860, isoform A n=1 Tax=Clunio marinus TaxID=568069 RepID=A0A1J1IXC9_9DIPT|nr:CLUMA_CG017860, isoform A [Clunio marinus]
MNQQISSSAYLFRYGPFMNQKNILLNHEEGGLLIGRCSSVSLPSQYVSRNHIKIWWSEGKWFITDLNSFNGTFIYQNESEVRLNPNEIVEIFDGAIIGFGFYPSVWCKHENNINNPEYFVYQLQNSRSLEINELCDAFAMQVRLES